MQPKSISELPARSLEGNDRKTRWSSSLSYPEMDIYRDNLSAIVIGDNFLSIIVIAQNNCNLSIIIIAFVIYFVIADKLSR